MQNQENQQNQENKENHENNETRKTMKTNQSTARPNPHRCGNTNPHTAWGEQKPTGGGPERMVFLGGKSFDPDSILVVPLNLRSLHHFAGRHGHR